MTKNAQNDHKDKAATDYVNDQKQRGWAVTFSNYVHSCSAKIKASQLPDISNTGV